MASLAKFAFGKISYALSDYIMNPIPIAVKNQQGATVNIAINFTKPTQVNRVTQIGLIVIGNLDESSIQQLEQDLTAAIALGHLNNLLEKHKGKTDTDKFKLQQNSFSDYQLTNQGIAQLGVVLAKMIKKFTYLRKEIKKTSFAKGVKWNEDFDDFQVKAKEDKYKGKGSVIKYWAKGIMGQANWIIPLEAVQIWQHVRTYPGQEAEKLAQELYAVFISGDESKYKGLTVDIESLIRKENKARRKGKK
ncbi:MAG: hypothetical protein ACTSO5_05335 [Candidatus Heimdallarchaeaceae archaeon]